MRPRLLDLFCGAGGASMGYHRAGFDVVGVDIAPQPEYPFPLHVGDAVDALAQLKAGHRLRFEESDGSWRRLGLDDFVAEHASPPCQRFSTATADPTRHPDLIAPVRSGLLRLGRHYVIENVPGAPLLDPVRLCGSSFSLGVRRHRHFEANFELTGRDCRHAAQGTPVGVYGQHPDAEQHYRPNGQQRGMKARTIYEGQWAMGGVDWMGWHGLKESIPPAYTEHIGRQLLDHLGRLP